MFEHDTKTWHLTVAATGQTLPAPAGQTLLRSLLDAGVAWPASCRNGTCRTCIGWVEEGRARHGIEWPGLLPEEKAQGAVLPCVAYPEAHIALGGPGLKP